MVGGQSPTKGCPISALVTAMNLKFPCSFVVATGNLLGRLSRTATAHALCDLKRMTTRPTPEFHRKPRPWNPKASHSPGEGLTFGTSNKYGPNQGTKRLISRLWASETYILHQDLLCAGYLLGLHATYAPMGRICPLPSPRRWHRGRLRVEKLKGRRFPVSRASAQLFRRKHLLRSSSREVGIRIPTFCL